MNVFTLMQRIVFLLLQRLEEDEISVERMKEIAAMVLKLLPVDDSVNVDEQILNDIEKIPELRGIAFK